MTEIDVELYLSKACRPFRTLVNSMDMDDSVSMGLGPSLTRREIERQVRQWKKNKKSGAESSGPAKAQGETPHE